MSIEILEDTYLGLLLRPHHPSIRKSQLQSPKFYFFDSGVQRQLSEMLSSPLVKSTSYYGDLFEAFIIQEINRVNHYRELEYNLSFYSSKNGFEVDLILSRGKERIFVEIKSTNNVDSVEVRAFDTALADVESLRIIYISQDPKSLRIGRVECIHYKTFIASLK